MIDPSSSEYETDNEDVPDAHPNADARSMDRTGSRSPNPSADTKSINSNPGPAMVSSRHNMFYVKYLIVNFAGWNWRWGWPLSLSVGNK